MNQHYVRQLINDAAYRAARRERWRKRLAEDWKHTDAEGWPA